MDKFSTNLGTYSLGVDRSVTYYANPYLGGNSSINWDPGPGPIGPGFGDWDAPWDAGNGGGAPGFGSNLPPWLQGLAQGLGINWESIGQWFGRLIDPSDGKPKMGSKEEKGQALEALFAQRPNVKGLFITFLRNAGTAITWVNQFINSPAYNWPVFLIDLALFWLEKGAPTEARQAGFSEAASQAQLVVPPGGNLPVPGPGIPGGLEAIAPTVMAATPTMVYKAPPGFVTVTIQGQKVWMRKQVAYSLGYKKRRKRPPFSAAEWETLKTAGRVEEKVKRLSTRNFRKYKCVRK